MVCANVTGFFYTVWTCFKGEEEDGADAKPGLLENMSLSFEEKAYKAKSKLKSLFTSRKEKRNWKLQKTITAEKRLERLHRCQKSLKSSSWRSKMISYKT